jgi:hypothetical protein
MDFSVGQWFPALVDGFQRSSWPMASSYRRTFHTLSLDANLGR